MKLLKEIMKGVLMGIANIIPGVSGGTMAVSMGIYDTIISSITNLFKDFKKSIKTLWPYLIGMLLGIAGLSFLIEYLFSNFPLQTSMIFIGLILGGFPVITSKIKGQKLGASHIITFFIFFSIIIVMQIFKTNKVTTLSTSFQIVQTIQLFFVGVIASATMVIPGVSGSLILMLLGYYTPIIETISTFIKSAMSFEVSSILGGFTILIPFGLGVLFGLFAVAKLIEFLLGRFELLTYSAIMGLVIASPIAILLNIGQLKLNFITILTSIPAFAIGFYISYRLSKETPH